MNKVIFLRVIPNAPYIAGLFSLDSANMNSFQPFTGFEACSAYFFCVWFIFLNWDSLFSHMFRLVLNQTCKGTRSQSCLCSTFPWRSNSQIRNIRPHWIQAFGSSDEWEHQTVWVLPHCTSVCTLAWTLLVVSRLGRLQISSHFAYLLIYFV